MKKVFIALPLIFVLIGCQPNTKTQLTFQLTKEDGSVVEKTVACHKKELKEARCQKIKQTGRSVWVGTVFNKKCLEESQSLSPIRVVVFGVINGEPVSTTFSLNGGCEKERFNKMDPVFKSVFGDKFL